MKNCPTKQELFEFDNGKLEARRGDEIADHIELCEPCSTILDEFDSSKQNESSIIQNLREPISKVFLEDDDELDELVDNVIQAKGTERRKSKEKSRPKRIGEYEIKDEIARGGMGIVYRAFQKSLNRTVAIKMILTPKFADPSNLDRFYLEAKAVAALVHPGIVSIHEIGEHEGHPFFSMSYIDGVSLSEVLKNGPMPPQQACEIVRDISKAVQFAHDNGIIHRDLKPSNVLLSKTKPGATLSDPKILDFGLAKFVGGGNELTSTGQIMGTPSYMSPEQAMGEVAETGFSSDVYGIGAILYHALAGRPPFQADHAIETIKHVVSQQPVPPKQLNAAIDRDLNTICLKCLEKEPLLRYPSAKEVEEELNRFLEGRPIKASPPNVIDRSWRWCKRNPLVASLIAMVFVITLVSTIVGVEMRKASVRREATLNRQRAKSVALEKVNTLKTADTRQVEFIAEDLKEYWTYAEPELIKAFYNFSVDESNEKLHVAMALAQESDSEAISHLKDRIFDVEATQFVFVRKFLAAHPEKITDEFWRLVCDKEQPAELRFRSACTLAVVSNDHENWQKAELGEFLADYLVNVRSSELLLWRDALEPVKKHLIEPLEAKYHENLWGQDRKMIGRLLVRYAREDPSTIFDLMVQTPEPYYDFLYEELMKFPEQAIELALTEIAKDPDENQLHYHVKDAKDYQVKDAKDHRRANAAILLFRLGKSEKTWNLLKHSPYPGARLYFTNWLGAKQKDAEPVLRRLKVERDGWARRALILCLGKLRVDEAWKEELARELKSIFQNDRDAGMHAAAEWLLKKWKHDSELAMLIRDLKLSEQQISETKWNDQSWFINSRGQPFTVLKADEFKMGNPEWKAGKGYSDKLHRRVLNRCFAISQKETTQGEWRQFVMAPGQFVKDSGREWGGLHPVGSGSHKQVIPYDESPMLGLSWYDAVAYCNWLSHKAGIPEEQWCYEPDAKGNYTHGMKAKKEFWKLTGYRLPTDAEWEYACRAGASSRLFFGESELLMRDYGWTNRYAKKQVHPVGTLKPNDFGIFDIYGNASEWVHDAFYFTRESVVQDHPVAGPVFMNSRRIYRGGNFLSEAWSIISAKRNHAFANQFEKSIGLRVARTMPSK